MKINRKENFKFLKYIIFFGLLFFQFSLNVSAAGSSGGSNGSAQAKLVNISTLQEASAKTVIADSFSLGYFQMGESTTLAKYRTIYEDTHGTNYSKNDFLDWIVDNNLKLQQGTEILCYNDCVIFRDTANGVNVLKTGWLYEYCDTSRYLEWIDNRVAIGDGNVPLYFGPDGSESFMTLFPSYYFYYPVSSMTSGGLCITQLPTTGITGLNAIKNAYSKSATIHKVSDFSGINGKYNLDNGVSAADAWIMSFVCNEMIDTTVEGVSFTKGYPVLWSSVKNTAKKYPALAGYMNTSSIKSSGYCMNIKNNTQLLGLDIMFAGVTSRATNNMKMYSKDFGRVLDVGATISKVTELIGDTPLSNSSASIYKNAAVQTSISAGYLNVPSVSPS